MHEIIIVPENSGQRLDKFIADAGLELSRSQAHQLIEKQNIKVNKRASKPSYILKTDDRIEIDAPKPQPIDAKPQDIPVEIIYQDDDIAVINKPSGLVVHPAPGNYDKTLVNALLYHLNNLSGIGGKLRPGIVHRLDRDTSGIMIVAKNDKAHASLSHQLKERKIEKIYKAIVHGRLNQLSGRIETSFGRHPGDRKKMSTLKNASGTRLAISEFEVEENYKDYTLVKVRIITGRTHQIRVHMSHIKHPVVGDALYGKKKEKIHVGRQMLHAYSLGFIHPSTNKHMSFKADLPLDFTEFLDKIKKIS